MITKERIAGLGTFLFFVGLGLAIVTNILFNGFSFAFILARIYRVMMPLGVLSWIASGFISSKKKKNNKKMIEELQSYFLTANSLRVSENVTIRKDKGITRLDDISVYYGEDRVCTFDEYIEYSKEDYRKIVNSITSDYETESFVDENNNGIDDRIETAEYFIEKINELENSIHNEQIKQGLDEVIKQLRDIKYLETKYENILPKLSKLYERYLPILMSILESYSQLLFTNTSTDEITFTEEKLKKTIILVNEALTSIKTELIKDDIMNLSTDMSVLEMVLKQDGLVEDELTMISKKE